MGIWNGLLRRWGWRTSTPTAPLKLTLYTRPDCHLCEEARSLLRELQADFSFQVEMVDIESHPQLIAAYGDKVPVIAVGGKARLWGRINGVLLRRLVRTLK